MLRNSSMACWRARFGWKFLRMMLTNVSHSMMGALLAFASFCCRRQQHQVLIHPASDLQQARLIPRIELLEHPLHLLDPSLKRADVSCLVVCELGSWSA